MYAILEWEWCMRLRFFRVTMPKIKKVYQEIPIIYENLFFDCSIYVLRYLALVALQYYNVPDGSGAVII